MLVKFSLRYAEVYKQGWDISKGLTYECTETGDWIVEWNVDLDGVGDELF